MEVKHQAMAAEKQVTAANRRRARLSGWVLSQSQVTLAICGIVVGLLVSFGVGFLSGVWFQTQAQMVTRDDAIALADGQLDREKTVSSPSPEQEMTFYSSLTSRDGTADSASPPQAAPVSKPQEPSSATASLPPSTAASLATETVQANGDQPQASETRVVETQSVNLPEGGLEKTENADSATLPTATSQTPAASEPSVAERVPPKLEQEASTAPTSAAPFYSVQVGSFRRAEQAYQLQDQLIKKGYQARIGLSMVQGQGAWYRVRVGHYADRSSADKAAQRLQENEKMDVLVMRDSS
jgi:cell division protein FtsN